MTKPPEALSEPDGWSPRIRTEEELEEALERLPDQPGVYLMRDREGRVVYVGKARRLRVRVRQYFAGQDTRLFVPLLAKIIGDIETVVTTNDKEALLLENNLIKEHKPRFNVQLRDDKNYLVLRIDPAARWPRLEVVRRIERDGAQYFGPYHSAKSARSTLRAANRHFRLRTCTDYVLDRRTRPCLQFQIGRCPAPCVHDVDPERYAEQVRDVGLFLTGRHRELIAGLRERMEADAANLDFEAAARSRDQLQSIETTLQSQQVVSTEGLDQDVFGLHREGGQVEFAVLRIRQGKLLSSQAFSERGMELPDAEVLANFVSVYYERTASFPDEILLPFDLAEDDEAPLLAWLRERKGKRVRGLVPRRGTRRKLVRLASRNAASSFVTRRNRKEDTAAALARLQARLGLIKAPTTIECYDISHTRGTDTVASMVVFVDGVADKSRYRSFKIRGSEREDASLQDDDFASMYEVLSRRFKRAMQDTSDDDWSLPDLIVVDGGKGQLGRVIAAMDDLGIPVGAEGVDVVALAKERRAEPRRARDAGVESTAIAKDQAPAEDEAAAPSGYGEWVARQTSQEPISADDLEVRPERVYVPGVKDPIRLRPGSSERYLMERVRDEAHRSAIRHHRKRRGKRSLHSALDDVEGVGPVLKRALIQRFGSVAAIKAADMDALVEVQGIGKALARKIHEALDDG
jgi:excinuclease ABC subunit C